MLELMILALALSMDAFAISVSNGLGLNRFRLKSALIVGLYYGIAQALMPLAGYWIGKSFADKIDSIDHWVAFTLLAVIGVRMLYEGLKKQEDAPHKETSLAPAAMLPLAIADSIDALAVGVTFSFSEMNVYLAAFVIGLTTLLISMLGVRLGSLFGLRYKNKAELAGGIILILLGVHALADGLSPLAL